MITCDGVYGLEKVMKRHGGSLLAAFGLVAALVWALLPGTPGYAQDGTPPGVPEGVVSVVNGEPITLEAFYARVRLVRWQYLKELQTLYDATGGHLQLAQQHVIDRVTSLQNPAQLGEDVLYQMEEERLLWQAAGKLGITPTADETQQQEAAFFSLWTNVPVEQMSTDPQAQAFITAWYAEATAISGMSAEDIRSLFQTNALRQRLYAFVAEGVPTEELAVHTRHILCGFHPDNPSDLSAPTPDQRAAAQTCIDTALERLRAGDSFEAVARDLSDDHASAQQGGDVGWVLISYLAENYAIVARDSALNTLIGPVETEFGLHLIEVLERAMQPLSAEELDASRSGYFQLWVQTLHDDASITHNPGWADGLPVDPALDTLDPAILGAIETIIKIP